jgi:(1->4)-alpha-D-glucan 1-alpha-D-glucosylmutase
MNAPLVLSTYRLQLHAGFDFQRARDLCDYLAELGVSHVYVSPILRAERGSTYGYNVCAYDQIGPELGGDDGFRAFSDELRRLGLRLLVDFVPNHMGIATGENAWWNDVLENGPSSRFADFFDIEWAPTKASLHNRVLYPILGAQYGEVLERGELVLAREGGAFVIRYFEHQLPVAPRSLRPVFELTLAKLRTGETPPPAHDLDELESILTAMRNLPAAHETDPLRRAERAREKEVIKRRLEALVDASVALAHALDEVVAEYNGNKGDVSSFDKLDALLREQNFRLAYWRVATEEINYRRFFDIDQLAAVRMELPVVFEAAHRRILELVREGRVDGLRLDHTDGLYDPAEYFERLRAAGAGGTYVVAEKILEPGERLPRGWKIEGTTGYDALALLGSVWVDGDSESAFTSLYRSITHDLLPFEQHVYDGKRAVMRASFSAEVNVLALALERIADGNRRSCDFTLNGLRSAIHETIAAFPVYRTYVRADGLRGVNDDRHILRAIDAAMRRRVDVDASIFEFLRDVLLLRDVPGESTTERDARVGFAMRFQQLTGPIMAKGVEDTALYRYVRLVSLNEVGGDASRFGTSVRLFHEAAAERVRDWPLSMVATSTHDTKRGEDVRARLAVLTECPERWANCVEAWLRMAKKHQRTVDEAAAPSTADAYLFLQTVLGAWPFCGIDADREAYAGRIAAYMEKATREAKTQTSWLHPRAEYERATTEFVHAMLSDVDFARGVQALADDTATFAASNALGQVALKILGPGVPDTYQGSELWNFALVDPDNRTAVDYDVRRKILRALQREEHDRGALCERLLARFTDGAVKLYVTQALLALRRREPELLVGGAYCAIDAGEHVIAFTRETKERTLACVVPRLAWKLTRGEHRWPIGAAWGDRAIALPAGRRWSNVLTGETRTWTTDAPLRDVLKSFPIGVFLGESPIGAP